MTFSYVFYNIENITLTCKRYKFVDELVGFINDLSIICGICSTKVLTGICVVPSIRKIVSLLKKYLIPLSSLCKLYHETDCHGFHKYKQSHCGITLGPHTNSRYREKYPLGLFLRKHSPIHRKVQSWQL